MRIRGSTGMRRRGVSTLAIVMLALQIAVCRPRRGRARSSRRMARRRLRQSGRRRCRRRGSLRPVVHHQGACCILHDIAATPPDAPASAATTIAFLEGEVRCPRRQMRPARAATPKARRNRPERRPAGAADSGAALRAAALRVRPGVSFSFRFAVHGRAALPQAPPAKSLRVSVRKARLDHALTPCVGLPLDRSGSPFSAPPDANAAATRRAAFLSPRCAAPLSALPTSLFTWARSAPARVGNPQ